MIATVEGGRAVKVTRNKLSVRQARVFARMAFDLYEAGEIDLEELERQLDGLPDCIRAHEAGEPSETPA